MDTKRFELLLEDFRCLSGQLSEEALRDNGPASWKLLQFLQNPFPVRQVPERFRKLPEKMRQNLDRPISLKEPAGDSRRTRIHLIREFRKYFGDTPYRMLRSLRMRLASNLLLNNPDLSIKEITAQVGYDNALTCSAEFKKISRRVAPLFSHQTGVAPTSRRSCSEARPAMRLHQVAGAFPGGVRTNSKRTPFRIISCTSR